MEHTCQFEGCTRSFATAKALAMHGRSHSADGKTPVRLPCDGSIEDYKRHLYRGEEACPASKSAWRTKYSKKGPRR